MPTPHQDIKQRTKASGPTDTICISSFIKQKKKNSMKQTSQELHFGIPIHVGCQDDTMEPHSLSFCP